MAEAQAGSGKVTLFSQKKRGGLTYRIPALLYLPSESTFLAFAEERSSPRDEDAKFLVMRRGRKEGTSVQWGPQEPLPMATLPKYRTMNPCPVHEEKSRTTFLFFICVLDHVTARRQIATGRNAAKLCYVSSQDGGRTWSQAVDLTRQMFGGERRKWATFAVGPGHGMQLGSGRLVVPAYAYRTRKRCFCFCPLCCAAPHCFALLSDDGGRSWARGRLLEDLRATECQLAEINRQDGSRLLYINARHSGWSRCRAEAFSADNGGHFHKSFLCKQLPEPPHGCQGSVVSFAPAPKASDLGLEEGAGESASLLGVNPSSERRSAKSWLVFSHPTNSHKRSDLGIYLNPSPLEKGCWAAPWVLNKGPSGYSDLAVCQEEGKPVMFGCLFECGAAAACEEIAFQLFSDVELLKNLRPGNRRIAEQSGTPRVI
nr:sialidase-3-like [Podarcis muralis]